MNQLIYTFIMLFMTFLASGQNYLLLKKGSNYYFQDEIYDRSELGDVYELHQPSLDLYVNGSDNKRSAKKTAMTGLVFLGSGLTLSLLSISQSFQNGGELKVLTTLGLTSLAISGILEIIAISLSYEGGYKLKKAQEGFNNEMLERHGYKTDHSLSLGMTMNGIGLVYQF